MNDFSLLIQAWYRLNKRDLPWRNTNDPYLIWLSEIILQQTRVDQGMSYYTKFSNNYPTVNDLASSNEQDILNDWQGLGYYSRARNLHYAAKQITTEFKGQFPTTFKEIKKLKGIGDYTAAAISSFAFNEVKAVVDGNVYRVLSRVFDINTPIDSTQGKKEFQALADELIDSNNPAIHNQAIMEIGALVCTPKQPDCNNCPLSSICLSRENDVWKSRPVKAKKIKQRKRYFHFNIYQNKENLILEKRTESDIWQNMYQFPLIETNTLHRSEQSMRVKHVSNEIKHVLSHQIIYAKFYHFEDLPKTLKKNWIKIKIEELDNYPLPRLIDKYIIDNFAS